MSTKENIMKRVGIHSHRRLTVGDFIEFMSQDRIPFGYQITILKKVRQPEGTWIATALIAPDRSEEIRFEMKDIIESNLVVVHSTKYGEHSFQNRAVPARFLEGISSGIESAIAEEIMPRIPYINWKAEGKVIPMTFRIVRLAAFLVLGVSAIFIFLNWDAFLSIPHFLLVSVMGSLMAIILTYLEPSRNSKI